MKKVIFLLVFEITIFQQGYSQGWDDVGGGINGYPAYMGVYKDKLFLSGSFSYTRTDSLETYHFAFWDGYSYGLPVKGTDLTGGAYSWAIYNNDLYAGGSIGYIDDTIIVNQIARWDGTQWYSLKTTNNDNGNIYAMSVYKNELYVGGNMTMVGGVNVNRIARWNGTSWRSVGGGVTGWIEVIYCMAVFKDELYVGGIFLNAGGNPAYFIARWNGSVWRDVGGGLNDAINSFVVDSSKGLLYVGGGFTMAGNDTIKYIAAWDGANWLKVGDPLQYGCMDLEMYHDELYVANAEDAYWWTETDTVLSKWNGIEWKRIDGIYMTVYNLKVYHDSLFVTGGFKKVNGMPVSYIASYYSPPDSTGVFIEPAITYKKLTPTPNYPNPVNSATHIPYSLPQGEKGVLKIYGISGELKASYSLQAGSKVFELPVDEFASGVYIYTITAKGSGTVEYRKMVVVR